ncbi:uncharacterized protein MCYG_02261 [Microsporum canis CBS 113480]|uniref:Uncharacterized protein n=1 Tax=Arthroderma otae (strain ATCC MYA-4605 / CBS 113480) TaxID=554155 RepID=C5FFJ5_ARTOC|nr:uncharacterized protein MCYG_02261 [Microsporum canis CBS 113480]EEQ29442.1 predicted protein [Microsporum canis CBS 113480]
MVTLVCVPEFCCLVQRTQREGFVVFLIQGVFCFLIDLLLSLKLAFLVAMGDGRHQPLNNRHTVIYIVRRRHAGEMMVYYIDNKRPRLKEKKKPYLRKSDKTPFSLNSS